MRLRKKKLQNQTEAGTSIQQQQQQQQQRKASEESNSHVDRQQHNRFHAESTGPVDPDLGERQYSIFSEASTLVSPEERSRPVNEEMIHGLADFEFLALKRGEPFLRDAVKEFVDPDVIRANERRIEGLSSELWQHVASFMSPADAASLAFTSRTLHRKLGSGKPWATLNLPENKEYKIAFLTYLDRYLPNHLLCFPCATYHRRLRPGQERYKADYVNNPLFICPRVRHSVLPRMRITHGRELPFAYAQLVLRAHRHSSLLYGLPPDALSRRWKCHDSGWSHQTRFIIHPGGGHLLFRCVSRCFAAADLSPSEQRLLLYSRNGNYEPYFSVCAHWRDGELMNVCKCALTHIPLPRKGYREQLREKPKLSASARNVNPIVQMCNDCLYMRRCPRCPTEYVVAIKWVEDRDDRVTPFKHAIVVTRWSDLGDGSTPSSSNPEWQACNGQGDMDSFGTIGRRAISGAFESAVNGCPPGQRILSLNPNNINKGEEGTGWY